MNAPWEDVAVSALLLRPSPVDYSEAEWCRCLTSVLEQDCPVNEVIVADIGSAATSSAGEGYSELPISDSRVQHLPGCHPHRAAALQAVCAAARGEYLLLVVNDAAPVYLRRSAVQTLLMAATRRAGVGMVYADYDLVAPDGTVTEVHLHDYHPGRLRETLDLGRVWLLNADVLRAAGGVNVEYRHAELYDLRLRLAARAELVHVGNRTAGSLYRVKDSPRVHDVFDYLRDDHAAQREYEQALTEHLKRIGAYLSPTRDFEPVTYTPKEEEAFRDCLASVVIPVNHRPEFIETALKSVLSQTRQNLEVIVIVNGGPDDPTCAAVRAYLPGGDRHRRDGPVVRLLVVDINNIGFCLNAGIAAARGKYYIQLDSDDRLKPDAVARLVEVFESDSAIGMVIGSYEVWELDAQSGALLRVSNLPAVTHGEWTAENGPNNLLRVNGAGAPRAAHIKAIKEVGWFGVNDTPSARNYGEDYDLVLRFSERYRIGRVWQAIYEVVRHAGGTDHVIDQATIARNDDAKDEMRLAALRRRQKLNCAIGSSGAGTQP